MLRRSGFDEKGSARDKAESKIIQESNLIPVSHSGMVSQVEHSSILAEIRTMKHVHIEGRTPEPNSFPSREPQDCVRGTTSLPDDSIH